ncbi:sugar phosphate isomerase/epimerase [Paenibacillus sp. CAA11]|uniref:sugar phosphate isomerase/epimerase family protein n=1 Tax=Paenibacillus sp. CAA11 TaxID=1532905 RepID=UPI000D35ADE5|nr:sugar phosphate isomerase/epimerase family protein [Paenibacillus sp. CAA11]AWB45135.1 sugar phosphate isomerase/epimerase [Paenibacillus sp. CAA11]
MVQVGLQLYTVREQLEQDFEGTLQRIAELGYQGVEFAGFYGRTAEQVQEILQKTGLKALGAHTPYARLKNHLDEEIAFNKQIGNSYLIFPYLAEEDRNRWDEIIEDIRKIGLKCQQQEMTLFYHNHEFELTSSLEGEPVLDKIFGRVPASQLQVELDACWVHYAGYDPLEYIMKYAGRLPLLHLKDMITRPDGSAETVELGQGEVEIKRIADAGISAGVEWLIVEQDFCAKPPMESIELSMKWLRTYQNEGGQIHV